MSRFTGLRTRLHNRIDASAEHPLLACMAEGTVTPDVFRRYLIREGAFVRVAARTSGYLVWRAPDWEAVTRHSAILADLTGVQDAYFTDRGVGDAVNALSGDPGPLGTLIGVAENTGYGAVVACMCAAETLYAQWCAAAPPHTGGAPDVTAWIRMHTSDTFTASAAFWQAQVDAIDTGELTDDQLDMWFIRMLDAEDAFHDLPLQPEGA